MVCFEAFKCILDIALHMTETVACLVLLDIVKEFEKKVHVSDNHNACLYMRLKSGVTCVWKTDQEANFMIKEEAEHVLLTTFAIFVMENCSSKTGCLNSTSF